MQTFLKLVYFGACTNIHEKNVYPLPILFIPIVDGNVEMLDNLLTHGKCFKMNSDLYIIDDWLTFGTFQYMLAYYRECRLKFILNPREDGVDDGRRIRMVRHLIKAGEIAEHMRENLRF